MKRLLEEEEKLLGEGEELLEEEEELLEEEGQLLEQLLINITDTENGMIIIMTIII